jgi:4-amino-4-deoxy-L-arabinose transferase-like glycosyltransferase
MAALLAVWMAMERDSTAWWLLAGLCMALGFLSKFFSPFLWVGLLLFLVWAPEFRGQLRRPGMWLALGLNLLGAVPVLMWNAAHGWITAIHLRERGGLDHGTSFNLGTLAEFSGSVAGLLNPVFFAAILVAVWGFVRLRRKPALWRFLFCASTPVFVFYLVLACRAKAQPNWSGPAAPVLFLFAVLWWHARFDQGSHAPVRWLAAGLAIGLPAVTFLHEPRLLEKALGFHLSEKANPVNRVRGGSALAKIVDEQRTLLMQEGVPVFLIADHYGRASLLNFYLPEARALLPDRQLAYVLSSDKPQNQYWYWPSYEERSGENAIFVLNGNSRRKAPKRLRDEFASVRSLGVFKVSREGRVCSRVQLFACRGKYSRAEGIGAQLTHSP